MTPGQTRVLALLGVLLGIEAVLNPNVRRLLTGHLNPSESKPSALGIPHTYIAGYVGVGASVVALVALAAPAPKIATWIVAIFIALAILTNSAEWVPLLNQATQGYTQLFNGGGGGNNQAKK